MTSAFLSLFQRLAQPPSVEISVVSEPWSEPTGTVLLSGGSRKAVSFSTVVQSYVIFVLSCTLLLSSRIPCSSAPVKRFKPDEVLRQSHCSSPQHLLLICAPNEMASSVSGVPHLIRRPVHKARSTVRLCHECYSGKRFYNIKGYVSSPICLAVQPVHSDVTSFSPAVPFISASRKLGGVQFGDLNPSSIAIWAWPIKGYKKVSPLSSCLIFKATVSKPTFTWGSLAISANFLIIFSGLIEIITETDMHTTFDLSCMKSSHSLCLLVGSPGQATLLPSFFHEMRAVLPCASFMRNFFPPNTKWRCVSLSLAVLSSYIPVCLELEDATDVVSTIFRGADWIVTSLIVTKSQAFGIALSLVPTHSSHASSPLSFYLRSFSSVSLYASMLVVVRVCLNSFFICSSNV